MNVPEVITPEKMIYGRDLISVNIVPSLYMDPDLEGDPSFDLNLDVIDNYNKLRKVRNNLFQIYENEFLSGLMIQATEKRGRYLPIKHNKLKI